MLHLQENVVHYNDVIVNAMASQITSLTIDFSTVYSGAYQRKLQCSASLAFVREIHRWPVNSPHKGPVTRKGFPFDDVIMHQHGGCIYVRDICATGHQRKGRPVSGIWWRHGVKMLSALLTLNWGIHVSSVDSRQEPSVMQTFWCFLCWYPEQSIEQSSGWRVEMP